MRSQLEFNIITLLRLIRRSKTIIENYRIRFRIESRKGNIVRVDVKIIKEREK